MKHYVCEVIRIFARSAGIVGLIVSVLVLAGGAYETVLPIVFQRGSWGEELRLLFQHHHIDTLFVIRIVQAIQSLPHKKVSYRMCFPNIMDSNRSCSGIT